MLIALIPTQSIICHLIVRIYVQLTLYLHMKVCNNGGCEIMESIAFDIILITMVVTGVIIGLLKNRSS
jgi:heme/copper-type cytochrome/quinol oxidase subunit 4